MAPEIIANLSFSSELPDKKWKIQVGASGGISLPLDRRGFVCPAAEAFVSQDEVEQRELPLGLVRYGEWPDIRRPIKPLYKSEREFVDLILQGKTKKHGRQGDVRAEIARNFRHERPPFRSVLPSFVNSSPCHFPLFLLRFLVYTGRHWPIQSLNQNTPHGINPHVGVKTMSNEKKGHFFSIANSSGFPLQIRVADAINKSSGWRVILEEHPWRSVVDNNSEVCWGGGRRCKEYFRKGASEAGEHLVLFICRCKLTLWGKAAALISFLKFPKITIPEELHLSPEEQRQLKFNYSFPLSRIWLKIVKRSASPSQARPQGEAVSEVDNLFEEIIS